MEVIHHFILKRRYFFLFVSLLLYFIISPFLVELRGASYIFGVLFTIVILFSVYVIEKNKKFIYVIGLLGLLVFFGSWVIRVLNLDTFYYSIDYAITIIFFSLITMTVLASVIRDKRITSSTLFGAICGYLLIGLTWCFVYSLIYTLNNQAFILPHSITTDDIKTQQFIYYSFVTLSTLGYGDITPAIPVAKTFSWLQAILGQVYLTVWIARLVGLHISQSERGRKNVEKN